MSENYSNLKKLWTPPNKPPSKRRRERNLINKFERCGAETISRINKLNPSLVLDLGCGKNQYKPYIKNLVGIDLVDKGADIIADISNLSYDDETVDACLCYGSINFGNDDTIEKQIKEMKRVLKKNGIAVFRGNMNEHDSEAYYNWTKELVHKWTEHFNFTFIVEPTLINRLKKSGQINENWKDRVSKRSNGELNRRSTQRLFWIWQK